MLLIADGGSTKTNWCLIDKAGNKTNFNTEGYNPYFVDEEYIEASLRTNLPFGLDLQDVKEVNFYGAGVHNDEKAQIVQKAIKSIFTNAEVFVKHDLLAAARATLGTGSGFAAILGTGTNTCIYDGHDVTYNIDSLAYILGDEGSGCYIGKKLLSDYIRGYMPPAVQENFWNTYKLSHDEILDNIYTKPLANRFCAGFSKFAYDNNVNPEYTLNIVRTAFDDFFRNLVSRYPAYQNYSFNCIGAVGFSFEDILEEVASSYNMKIGKIIRSPIDDLVKYHLENPAS
ncbi:MAG TPA: N-acetylglucosamine kinase [Sphingobacteriaceae bacterium]|nr:N-acetylglucosamine kinase [Sphingobacteriaceae bacterium]